jgi:predicted aspartyl protease
MRSLLVAIFSILAFSAARGGEQGPCHLQRLAQIDMGMDDEGNVTVPLSIQGQTFAMVVDTGGVYSMLTPSTVAAVGGESRSLGRKSYILSGNIKLKEMATVKNVRLGNLVGDEEEFLVMPEDLVVPGDGGTFGADYLSHFDVDFDFAHAKLRLFSQDHCDGKVVYWTQDATALTIVPFDMDDEHHITVKVILDGKETTALLDTGAPYTLLHLEKAEDLFGFKANSPDLVPVDTNGGELLYSYPFKTIGFPGLTVDKPEIILDPKLASDLPRRAKMILGLNVLRQLHIFIAYKERKIYVTPASAH